ncbi:hypothetical protein SAMN05421827_102242 [Pedobacter terrae]|uniref:Uncharacterized protein n=1 Tax=Pedobacter terrae TaxID=405671 RepID=A0A1G7QAX2_9SPHI|nr:hypothetical protein [Pedobacter terrae]SDF95643.1 hypothetical protein SAMN05421827_102242 [Pedobacter terrae]
MNDFLNNTEFKTIPISEIEKGDFLVNLGPVLETEDVITHFNLIIDRLSEKQVIKFKRDIVLVTINQ